MFYRNKRRFSCSGGVASALAAGRLVRGFDDDGVVRFLLVLSCQNSCVLGARWGSRVNAVVGFAADDVAASALRERHAGAWLAWILAVELVL